jgi:hypothetical protein
MSGTSPDSMNSDVPGANTATPSRNNANGMKNSAPRSRRSRTRHDDPAVRRQRQPDLSPTSRTATGEPVAGVWTLRGWTRRQVEGSRGTGSTGFPETGQRKGLDGCSYLQRITPRRPGSLWSMVNVRRVEELTAAGRMRPAGLVEVRAAKADGRWEAAYASQREAVIPDDLAATLDQNPRARAAFESLGRTDRYLTMLPLLRARTPDGRAAQLAAAVVRLTRG